MGLLDRFRRKADPVGNLIASDHWSLVELPAEGGVGVLRWRTPVLSGKDAPAHPRCLRVLWGYAEEGSGAMPTPEQAAAMGVFEDRLVAALERDAHAVLTAVLTYDGARQWLFYTADVQECGARLTAMPQEPERYPIELSAEDDPEWRILREEMLQRVP